MGVLGVEPRSIVFFDHCDGELPGLSEPRMTQLAEQLADLLRAHGSQELYVPHRCDRHGDHEAAYRIAHMAAARSGLSMDVIQYAIWLTWWSPLFIRLWPWHLRGSSRLGIASVLEQKRQALHAYRSQAADLPQGLVQALTGTFEVYFR